MSRLGLALPFTQALPLPDYPALAAQAEAAGYDTLWTGEVNGPDAVTTMTLLASHTGRINVASGIIPIQTRTPIVLGMTAASLAQIAPGRIRLGLGISSRIIVSQWNGVPFERPLEQLREAVQVIRMVLAGERVNFEGRCYRIQNFRLMQPPPAKPVPIYLGALGPRMLQLAGEIADGVLLNWIPPEAVPGRSASSRSGRNAPDVPSPILKSPPSSGPRSPTTRNRRARRWTATSPGTASWTPTPSSSPPAASGTMWRRSLPRGVAATGKGR